jgi:hypothetical protein
MHDDDRRQEGTDSLADLLKVMSYCGARAGQWRDLGQIVAGTRLPAARVYPAVDELVQSGFLTKENEHPTPAGTTAPAWIRLDPTTTAAAR